MNTCIRSTFKCSFEVFKAKVMEDKSQSSKFIDDYHVEEPFKKRKNKKT